jgi:peptidoglycan/LPS O-acetylase OafA/YrhL
MISQKNEDEMQEGEQISSSVEEKHTTTSSEERSKQAPTSLRRWISVLLCILGVVLPFASVFIMTTPLESRETMNLDSNVFTLMVLGMFLMVFIGAALLRSWWSLLIVPVACAAAGILGFVLFWPIGADHFWDALSTILSLASLPIIICTAFGAGCGVIFREWLKHRQQRYFPERIA